MPMLIMGCMVGAFCALCAYLLDGSLGRIALTYIGCGTIGTLANAAFVAMTGGISSRSES
ncbi:hypothetical protein [Paracoccus shanxieyensis]|uniref:Uncharacterized protein n=1 Tax=Paracoccus shanxieyensis TaxID=2675752 RepID=A0A6L6IXD7_9RHOB|nr:hypothetical protein [Paracoccus shanxieyensis]MTH64268.1 hypothetical protein [Paracoccus shanxieyensis]MTH87412.1 hypothetical protein [Paracoccus shanxieyensis]